MRKILLSLLVFIFSLCTIPLFAGGSGVYPNGAEAFMIAAVPPPGFYGINYFAYLNLPDLTDDKGNNMGVFNHGRVVAEVQRIIWISKYNLFGGSYGMHLFIPFLYKELDFNAPVGPKGESHQQDFNLPYLIYSPFIWAKHLMKGKLHIVFSLPDIYIPIGTHDDKNLAGVGINWWTFEPVFALTYLPGPWELSLKFMYDFSTKGDDYPTPYGLKFDRTPGQEFHFDYNIAYAINKKFKIGINGFWYQQTTDDDYDDKSKAPAPVQKLLKGDEESHSKAFAIGPGIWMNINKFFLTVRYQQTFYERNYPEMKNFWVKLIWRF